MAGNSTASRGRQPGLFRLDNPLTIRFGAEYFAKLPQSPGVYFFSDQHSRLLYIGQSANLRARVGSYRHVSPERHPRRTLRLVARIHAIRWEDCESPLAAIERERTLLLEHRPPFNRAGVWIGPPWWLSTEMQAGKLSLALGREQTEIGPLPPAFRHVFGSLARCVYRVAYPELPWYGYPCGLMRAAVPLSLTLALGEEGRLLFAEGACGRVDELIRHFDAIPLPASAQQQEFWEEERERLMSYAVKHRVNRDVLQVLQA